MKFTIHFYYSLLAILKNIYYIYLRIESTLVKNHDYNEASLVNAETLQDVSIFATVAVLTFVKSIDNGSVILWS